MLHKIVGVKVKEVGVGELSKLIFKIDLVLLLLLLLGGGVVSGRECVEVGEIMRDVGRLATFVSFHVGVEVEGLGKVRGRKKAEKEE